MAGDDHFGLFCGFVISHDADLCRWFIVNDWQSNQYILHQWEYGINLITLADRQICGGSWTQIHNPGALPDPAAGCCDLCDINASLQEKTAVRTAVRRGRARVWLKLILHHHQLPHKARHPSAHRSERRVFHQETYQHTAVNFPLESLRRGLKRSDRCVTVPRGPSH